MNQILSTQNVNNKNYNKKGNKDIKSIVKFFAIFLAIFGICIVANSAYAIYKNINETAQVTNNEKPQIQISDENEEIVNVTIKYDGEIRDVEYYWNNPEESKKVDAKGKKNCQLKLEVPNGENTLTVIATGVDGEEAEYTKTFSVKKLIDIQMNQAGNNLKVTVIGTETLKEIKYTWDNDEEKKMDVNESEFSFEIDEISPGEHKIVVKAIDVNDNEEEKTKKVEGSYRPTVKIELGDDCYIIKAHDEVGLDRIEIETLEDGKVTKIQSDGKDFEYSYPLKENSDNLIRVKAYNVKSGESKAKRVTCTR